MFWMRKKKQNVYTLCEMGKREDWRHRRKKKEEKKKKKKNLDFNRNTLRKSWLEV